MKNLYLTIITVFSASYLIAQDNFEMNRKPEASASTEATAFDDRKVLSKIEFHELPEVVKKVISNGEYRKWDIEEAYTIHPEAGKTEGQSSYIIVVKRRLDRFALYYDVNGRLIRQERMEEVNEKS